ncbi:CheA signal transduction histidine kinase [Methylocaldum marinum]|uniref:CheA signal transduction histidine kinase n=1 Tax=Methylocaldum marinum TaxID=1432792 RepID=A0A250KPI2_9GAMM|nr:hypothetical protein [Methylocaldum marinum]BBA33442.1 CheA signal transduction histidine kinase [Methylocaldum marinum]
MSFGNYDQVRGLGGVMSGPQLAKLTRPRISHAVTRRRLFEALDAASVPIIWL